MTNALLLQLPVPQYHFGHYTGNIPLAAAHLKQSAKRSCPAVQVDIMPERLMDFLGDGALIDWICDRRPDIVCFTLYAWNLERSLHIARCLKETYGPRIICGGPEVTAYNALCHSDFVDTWVCGDGETIFPRLLCEPAGHFPKIISAAHDHPFEQTTSPYLNGLIDPEIENLVLLETQRGCPYRCAYCYYGKARQKPVAAPLETILKAVQWTWDRGIQELYLLDPSLNARNDLKALLTGIADTNKDRRIRLTSELRAETIDDHLADLFFQAGFRWFEIGLQTTNPRALALMNRNFIADDFIRGVNLLKERCITPRIDLILGLPGDTLADFQRSVDFVIAQGFDADVQVFPLLVLPGTQFRQQAEELGLNYESHPPYPVQSTADLNKDDMWTAIEYAEDHLDIALYPLPGPLFAWRTHSPNSPQNTVGTTIRMAEQAEYYSQLFITGRESMTDLKKMAHHLTNPYQLIIEVPNLHFAYINDVVSTLTRANPFTGLEIIFIEPDSPIDIDGILSSAALQRPHYLDQQMRYCYPLKGNRAILFTIVSTNPKPRYLGPMQRQLYWWRQANLPTIDELNRFDELDGIFIDPKPADNQRLKSWIRSMAESPEELPHIGFADRGLQAYWIQHIGKDDYHLDLLMQ